MVKGISRQVIVVHSPDPKLFEQAIFILKEDAVGKGSITDEALLKEAKNALHRAPGKRKRNFWLSGPAWACGGAGVVALFWLFTSFF